MSDTARLALVGAREFVVRATRTTNPEGERAARIVQLIDRALAEFAPTPTTPAPEERWEFPEAKVIPAEEE